MEKGEAVGTFYPMTFGTLKSMFCYALECHVYHVCLLKTRL